ncbi:MAG: sulfite exporter TauE/SafE family protein [Acidobacteriota bacterium]|nr:sulfite exporter TauE/SafE family protein [Acidobacteriota bacterium]
MNPHAATPVAIAGLSDLLLRFENWVGSISTWLAESVSGASDPVALGLCFAAGVMASLTPCVYPMIPIVVAYMGGAESAALSGGARTDRRRLRVVLRSLFYIGGMAVVYTALGLTAILIRRPFGSLTQSFWGYGLVGAVLLVFGLSLIGLFEIRVPSFILDRVGSGPRQGSLGAVAMGATSAVVAAPCAAPIVAPLAAWVARENRVVFGTLAMLSFSLGLGLLLLLIGISSGLAASLPRPGGWMVTLKRIMGVLMLVMAVIFLYWGGQLEGWW